jgi:hypothetical protein
LISVIREIHAVGWSVRLDLGGQVLAIDVPQHSFVRPYEDTLSPAAPLAFDGFVSAAALLWKAKLFDDGLLAAVGLAAQDGAGRFAGKAALLRPLAATLRQDPAADPAALALVFGACQLGGVPETLPQHARPIPDTAVAAFLGDEGKSKPLGFYSWSERLQGIFRQDRFLQGELSPRQAESPAAALGRDPAARATYLAALDLAARLTNPRAGPDLRSLLDDVPAETVPSTPPAFLPPSLSHEAVLVERLFGDRPIPDGFDLAAELVARVRSGQMSLAPTASSGWYDHLAWSLEPLIRPDAVPESGRLSLGGRYREHLGEVFKGMLALARETQVKQLKAAVAGAKGLRETVIHVAPDLSVEPLAELYRRRAACYRYVRGVLEEAFGPATLRNLHRLTPEGPVEPDLAGELTAMERLFEGAYRVACREIGHPPGDGAEDVAVAAFREWAKSLDRDAELGRDGRMMVPVFHDVGRKRTKVWAFLGWDRTLLNVRYETEPTVVSCERDVRPRHSADGTDRPARRVVPGTDPAALPRVEFQREWCEAATPVFAEVYVERLMDRDEFRRFCDLHPTREVILANLS